MASFLSDAKFKLQHSNKVSLAPRDIKNLAEMISIEKNVNTSSSKLSTDLKKSAEAIKEWGLGEGDDLADVLSKLSILFGHLADAQARFSDHNATYRIHFKSVRMREENLASLKKAKEALIGKIGALEKKITKMSSENKDLPTLTNRLQEFRSELISLEHSVSLEEARLLDFKRETVRDGFGLRLGAMLELAEKMTIISELGKILVAEIPVERTPPGGVRSPYNSFNRTQSIVEEAQRCLTSVIFNPSPSSVIEGLTPSSLVSPGSSGRDQATLQSFRSRNTTETTLPAELPPLYFSSTNLDRTTNPGDYGVNPKANIQDTNSSLSYAIDMSENNSAQPSHNPNTNLPRPPRSAELGSGNYSSLPERASSNLSLAPNPSLSSHSAPNSSVQNREEFYIRGPDGVIRSTGSAGSVEFQNTPYHTSTVPGEADQSPVNLKPAHHNHMYRDEGGREESDAMEPPVGRSAGENSLNNMISPASKPFRSPAHKTSSPTPGSSEVKTTNAGAFRRQVGAGGGHSSATGLTGPGPAYLNRFASAESINGEDREDRRPEFIAPLNIHKRPSNVPDHV